MENEHSIRNLIQSVAVVSTSGRLDQEVTCLITDSRRVVPGAMFFAIGGGRTNGNYYIEEAIDRGAVAIVSDQEPPTLRQVAYVKVADARVALADIAREFFKHPDESIDLFGVTGTNGKTTVSTLAQFLLQEDEQRVGLIGTVHYDLGRRTLPAYKTTPESVDCYAMFDQMKRSDCTRALIEISSHAIVQKRVEGMRIKGAAFLNLTQDHIDYHKDMDQYFAAKAQLFTGETGNQLQFAVVNLDDAYAERLVAMIPHQTKVLTFSTNSRTKADLLAKNIQLGPQGSSFTLQYEGNDYPVEIHLLGEYNVSNTLAALALAISAGATLDRCLARLAEFKGVFGRMERVDQGQDYNVVVDYAHTDDALDNMLSSLKAITPGKLYVVFGCGGDRDREKRAKMTTVVQQYAERAWATADNPRKESIEDIFADMREGVCDPATIEFVEDRRRAIEKALACASTGDCVVIAGKGHETFQEFAHTIVPFDDRQVARELIALKTNC